MTVHFRYDKGELISAVRTPEGFLLVEAFVAKPGILEYRQPDGSIRRELVTAETLHKADSLATLGRKPVTLEHPDGKVTPDNFAKLAVGDIDGEIEVVEGGFVKIKMSIKRRDALNAVARGTLEVSPGYTITIDETGGTHPVFGDYDAEQTSRAYNHAAITPAGRAGPSIRLRADSAADTRLPGETMHPKIIAALVMCLAAAGVRHDSSDVADADEKGVAGMLKDIADAFAEMKGKVDAFESKDADKPKHDQEVASEEEGEEGETEEEKADSRLRWHNDRTALEAAAVIHKLDSKKVAKMGNPALRKAVVLAARSDAQDDASADYYRAAFDMLPKAKASASKPRVDSAWTRVKPAGKVVGDGDDDETREDAPKGSWSDTINQQFTARHA